nr:MAG TPA: hypothetical protein [Caudoviricetes sp.]
MAKVQVVIVSFLTIPIALKKQHIRKVTEIRYTTCTPPTLIPDGGTLCERKP